MSFQLGVYDLFTYIIPGTLWSFELIFILSYYFRSNLFQKLLTVNIISAVVFIMIFYVIGHFMAIITRFYLRAFFKEKQQQESAYQKVKKEYPQLKLNFKAHQWGALCAIVQIESPERFAIIQWIESIHSMLRNISIVFLSHSLFELLYYILSDTFIYHIAIAIFSILLFIIIIYRSKHYLEKYYYVVFTTIIGRALKSAKIIDFD